MALKDQVLSIVTITVFKSFIERIQRILWTIFCNPSNSASFPLINAALTFCCLFCLYTHVDPKKVHGSSTGLILYIYQLCLLRISWCLLLKIAAEVGLSWMLISMHPLRLKSILPPFPNYPKTSLLQKWQYMSISNTWAKICILGWFGKPPTGHVYIQHIQGQSILVCDPCYNHVVHRIHGKFIIFLLLCLVKQTFTSFWLQ